jgi:hypothetical protein
VGSSTVGAVISHGHGVVSRVHTTVTSLFKLTIFSDLLNLQFFSLLYCLLVDFCFQKKIRNFN